MLPAKRRRHEDFLIGRASPVVFQLTERCRILLRVRRAVYKPAAGGGNGEARQAIFGPRGNARVIGGPAGGGGARGLAGYFGCPGRELRAAEVHGWHVAVAAAHAVAVVAVVISGSNSGLLRVTRSYPTPCATQVESAPTMRSSPGVVAGSCESEAAAL
jgi:hypothetical protein